MDSLTLELQDSRAIGCKYSDSIGFWWGISVCVCHYFRARPSGPEDDAYKQYAALDLDAIVLIRCRYIG